MDLECVICFYSFEEDAKLPARNRAKVAAAGSSSSSTGVNKSDQLCSTPCGHLFHNSCIRDWLKRGNTCPYCRKPFTAQDLKPVFLPAVANECSMVVNFETPISEESKRQMSTLLKEMVDIQTVEVVAEKVKTRKAEEEKKKLEERTAELQRQLEQERKKVQEELWKRVELQRQLHQEKKKVREAFGRHVELQGQLEEEKWKVREALGRQVELQEQLEEEKWKVREELRKRVELQGQLDDERWKGGEELGKRVDLQQQLDQEKNNVREELEKRKKFQEQHDTLKSDYGEVTSRYLAEREKTIAFEMKVTQLEEEVIKQQMIDSQTTQQSVTTREPITSSANGQDIWGARKGDELEMDNGMIWWWRPQRSN